MTPAPAFAGPAPLAQDHDLAHFDCGVPLLNEWLRKWGWKSHVSGGSRVSVVCHGNAVVGYYCLAVGAVFHDEAPGKVKRNMPDPVPVVVLGRLAVDQRHAGRGIGAGLLRDGVMNTLKASQLVGVRAMLVHAKNDQAKTFYERFGFRPSPVTPLTLMATLDDIKRALGI